MTIRRVIYNTVHAIYNPVHHTRSSMSKRTNICVLILITYIVFFTIFLRPPDEPDKSTSRQVGRRHVLQDTSAGNGAHNIEKQADNIQKKTENIHQEEVVNHRKGGSVAQGGFEATRYSKEMNKQAVPVGDYYQYKQETDTSTKYELHKKGTDKVIKYEDSDNQIIRNPEWSSSADLSRALSRFQYTDLLTLLGEVNELLNKAGITFVMGGNTLAGSYVFHDLIPWHDTIELMIDFKDLDKVFKTFSVVDLRKTYEVVSVGDPLDWFSMAMLLHQDPMWQNNKLIKTHQKKSSYKFRMFKKGSPFSTGQHWNWPFIDFSFFNVTEQEEGQLVYVYEVEATNSRHKYHLYTDFFPIHMRPFSHFWLPAPNHPQKVLSTMLEEDFMCRSRHIDNVRLKPLESTSADCNNLVGVYGHLDKQNVEGGVKETMIVSGRTVHSIFVKEPPLTGRISGHKYSIR